MVLYRSPTILGCFQFQPNHQYPPRVICRQIQDLTYCSTLLQNPTHPTLELDDHPSDSVFARYQADLVAFNLGRASLTQLPRQKMRSMTRQASFNVWNQEWRTQPLSNKLGAIHGQQHLIRTDCSSEAGPPASWSHHPETRIFTQWFWSSTLWHLRWSPKSSST